MIFLEKGIREIDTRVLKFKNLLTLNLSNNNIKVLENLPANLQELYVDFNQIDEIRLLKKNNLHENLVLLSISYNKLADNNLE